MFAGGVVASGAATNNAVANICNSCASGISGGQERSSAPVAAVSTPSQAQESARTH